jgi:hypothetical protein
MVGEPVEPWLVLVLLVLNLPKEAEPKDGNSLSMGKNIQWKVKKRLLDRMDWRHTKIQS